MTEKQQLEEEKKLLESDLKNPTNYPQFRIAAEAKLEYVKSKLREL